MARTLKSLLTHSKVLSPPRLGRECHVPDMIKSKETKVRGQLKPLHCTGLKIQVIMLQKKKKSKAKFKDLNEQRSLFNG